MKRKPWLKFHPQDWLADPHLRMCKPVSHGLLINLMALAHSGKPYGYLTNGGLAIQQQEASRILAWNRQTVSKAWADLEQNGRIVRAESGVWYIPRMVKDHAYSLQQSDLGKGGGNPTLKAPLKAPLKPEKNKSKRREEKTPPAAAMRLAESLIESIKSWKPDYKQPTAEQLKMWAADIDEAMMMDKRKDERIKAVIDWLPKHDSGGGFRWRNQILSGRKLRDKFDQLEIAIMQDSKPANKTNGLKPPTARFVEFK